jgi:glycosyltransferase involved in cell wall biosynthesis
MRTVSFILFAYNHEKYIREALDGFFSQNYSNIEYLIFDDASTDRTPDIILDYIKTNHKDHMCRFIRHKNNLGVVQTVNEAVASSSGEIIIPSAGDDISLPIEVSYAVAEFEKTGASLVAANAITIDEMGRELGLLYQRGHRAENLDGAIRRGHTGVSGAGSLWHRELFEVFGELPCDIRNEDDNISFRALLLNGIHFTPTPLLKYRLHAQSLSSWLWARENSEYVKDFYSNQKNVTAHYRSWCQMLQLSDKKTQDREIRLVGRLNFYEEEAILRGSSLLKRIIRLARKRKYVSRKEWFQLIGGTWAILIVRGLRKFRRRLAQFRFKGIGNDL